VLDDINNFCLAYLSPTAAFIQWCRSGVALTCMLDFEVVSFFTYSHSQIGKHNESLVEWQMINVLY